MNDEAPTSSPPIGPDDVAGHGEPSPPEASATAGRPEREPRRAADERRAIGRLTDSLLPALMAQFGAGGLGELEVRQGDWRVRLRKPPGAGPVTVVPAGPAASAARRAADAAAVSRPGGGSLAAVGPGRPEGTPAATSPERHSALAPAVGYFTPLEAVRPGHSVAAGDALGHVDVLGVRQPVVAPIDGVVGRVLAEVGEAVEYGQELVRIDAARPRLAAEEPG